MLIIGGNLKKDIRYRFVPDEFDGRDSITGQIQFTTSFEIAEIRSPSFVVIRDENLDDGEISVRLIDGDKTQGNLRIDVLGDNFQLPLLSAPIYYAVSKVIEDNVETANRVFQDKYEDDKFEWELREDLRDTVPFDSFLTVMDRLASHFHYYKKIMYRSATGYFAKRIDDRGPQQINSYNVLLDRVDKWNESKNTESINVDDVIAEYLGRNWIHHHLSGERNRLRNIGFNPIEYDSSWDSIVHSGWIAHTLLTDGEEAVKEFIRERPVPEKEPYQVLKQNAKSSQRNRWQDWGSVIPVTVREAEEEFHYDLYQYLRFAGRDYRGNAKINPLLYAGAAQLTGPLPAFFHQRITFQQQIAIGHEYRRDRNWQGARSAFENAERVASGETASGYDFDARKVAQAKKSRGHAEATILAIQGKESESVEKYKSTISELHRLGNTHDMPVEKEVEFLKDQMGNQLSNQ